MYSPGRMPLPYWETVPECCVKVAYSFLKRIRMKRSRPLEWLLPHGSGMRQDCFPASLIFFCRKISGALETQALFPDISLSMPELLRCSATLHLCRHTFLRNMKICWMQPVFAFSVCLKKNGRQDMTFRRSYKSFTARRDKNCGPQAGVRKLCLILRSLLRAYRNSAHASRPANVAHPVSFRR